MAHHILFYDFESYYDTEYSLSRMTPAEYILDPRWETIGCAFKVDNGKSEFVDGPDVSAYLSGFDPARTTTVAFNALFDNCILAWRYGFIPERMVCTMRLAVALCGHQLQRHSLAAVGQCLGVGAKGTTIENARGLHRADLMRDVGLWRAYQAYANNDNEMNAGIFDKLMPLLPTSERKIMDRVLRCCIEPKFHVDIGDEQSGLQGHVLYLSAMKALAMKTAGVDDPSELRSNDRFAELLKARGVDIQYKVSPTGKSIPAFAKTDEFMAELQEDEDQVVQCLATARLGLRSTIEESRGNRILSIARLPWPVTRCNRCHRPMKGSGAYDGVCECGGLIEHTPHTPLLPIPLKYAGAHTHRLSGDWSINMQNLPSGRGAGAQTNKLRRSLVAPPGHKVVVADKSQIECRLNAWICGQQDLLDLFATKADPYSVLASSIFEFVVDKVLHPTERFIGKNGELGLGFGCGPEKFYNMVVRSARVLGMDVKELLKIWTEELAARSVKTYRRTHGAIVGSWRELDHILKTAWIGQTLPMIFGPCEIGHGYVRGPNGLKMQYANPRIDPENNELRYEYGRRSYKMYGSKLLENIVQFLARIDTMDSAMRIDARGYRMVLQSHDELAWIVPDDKVEHCKVVALEEMRRVPAWAPDVPLDAECSYGQSYGDAK